MLGAGCQQEAPEVEVVTKVAPVAAKPVRPHRPLPRVPLTDEQAFRMFRAAPGPEDFAPAEPEEIEGQFLDSPAGKKIWSEWVRVADILAELSTDRLEKLVKRANTAGGVVDPEKGFWLNRWVFEVPEIYSYKKLGSCYPVSERTLNGNLINPLYPFGRDEDGGLRLMTNSFGYDIRGLPPFPYEEFLAFRRLFPRRKLPLGLPPDVECRERVYR